MANYMGYTRSNWFQITDENKFRNVIKHLQADNTIEYDIKEDKEHNLIASFACYGSILGFDLEENNPDPDCDPEYSYDKFVEALQDIIADDDACIIMEVGHEKLRYLTADAIIITNEETSSSNLSDVSLRKAKELLQNKDWDTNMYC